MAAPSQQTSVVPHSQTNKTSFYMSEDVIENILSFLPFKELCRLSVVSKRFRNSWKFCRDLSFDRSFARNLFKYEYRSIVNNFFANHSNTCADTFKLYYNATDEVDLVSFWISRAVSLGIKELEVDLSPSGQNFVLDYNLVDVESIKVMKLNKCELHLPLNSNGLRHLREITIQNVRVTVESILVNCVSLRALSLIRCNSIDSLKAYSPYLKTLVVKNCPDVYSITINAPSLKTFHYHGKMVEFNFYCDLPHLSDVILDIAHPRSFQLLCHRQDMANRLAHVETLTVSSTFLEGLSARFEDNEYKDMEFLLWKLKEFHLLVAPESFITPSDVVIFLHKCPYIERVFIDLGQNAFGRSIHWDRYGKNYLSECQMIFPYLKHVKITGFTMKELPQTMARYFLKNAIHLQCLVLVKARIRSSPYFYGPERVRFGIISNAQIEIYDYRKDESSVMPQHLRGCLR